MFDVSRATSTTSESANSFSFFLPFFSLSTECSYSENLENLVETNVMSKTSDETYELLGDHADQLKRLKCKCFLKCNLEFAIICVTSL